MFGVCSVGLLRLNGSAQAAAVLTCCSGLQGVPPCVDLHVSHLPHRRRDTGVNLTADRSPACLPSCLWLPSWPALPHAPRRTPTTSRWPLHPSCAACPSRSCGCWQSCRYESDSAQHAGTGHLCVCCFMWVVDTSVRPYALLRCVCRSDSSVGAALAWSIVWSLSCRVPCCPVCQPAMRATRGLCCPPPLHVPAHLHTLRCTSHCWSMTTSSP